MITVTQRNDNDCMLAAIATVLNVQYDSLWSPEFVERVTKERGCSTALTKEALGLAGLRDEIDYWHVVIYHDHEESAIKRLLKGRRAILSVASLNNDNGYHAVAWDGRTVHDVSNKMRYRFLSHLMIRGAWIFDETSANR